MRFEVGTIYTRLKPAAFEVEALEVEGRWYPVVDGDLITSGTYRDPTKPGGELSIGRTGFASEATAIFIAKLEAERLDAERRFLQFTAAAREEADRCILGGSRAAGLLASRYQKTADAIRHQFDLDGSMVEKTYSTLGY